MNKLVSVGLLLLNCLHANIHERGYWIGDEMKCEHSFDSRLANALVQFFIKERAQSLVDFGCGPGDYVKLFLKHGFVCEGYDGNPDSELLSGGVAKVIDLSEPILLDRVFDWVVSLEVGEHIPKEYELIFIENLHRHNTKGIVLSWALKGQGGAGHVNEQDGSYIKSIMAQYGYMNDVQAESKLRLQSTLPWFKKTIMVFRRV